jgi:radical SAM protein with 4Fe4S-binding SPASM domain
MKLVREYLYEKFEDQSDPVHDMDIGPQGNVYQCMTCGDLVDGDGGNVLEGDELEKAKTIINAFGNKRIMDTQCYNCYQEEIDRQQQEEYARAQQHEWERQQEEHQRWSNEDRYY